MRRLIFKAVLLFLTPGLLTACSERQPSNLTYLSTNSAVGVDNEGEYTKALPTLKQLDTALGNGDIDTTLSLFQPNATIQVVNPPYLKYTYPVEIWQLSTDEAVDGETGLAPSIKVTVHYSDEEGIKDYLSTLIYHKFKSDNSNFRVDGDSIVWSSDVALSNYIVQMDFMSVIEQGKIQSIIINNSNLVTYS